MCTTSSNKNMGPQLITWSAFESLLSSCPSTQHTGSVTYCQGSVFSLLLGMHKAAIRSQRQQCPSTSCSFIPAIQVSFSQVVTEQEVLSPEAILKAPSACQSQAIGSIKQLISVHSRAGIRKTQLMKFPLAIRLPLDIPDCLALSLSRRIQQKRRRAGSPCVTARQEGVTFCTGPLCHSSPRAFAAISFLLTLFWCHPSLEGMLTQSYRTFPSKPPTALALQNTQKNTLRSWQPQDAAPNYERLFWATCPKITPALNS